MIDKAKLRDLLTGLVEGHRFSPGPLGIEQATNAVMALERPARSLHEAALLVCCPYCGYTSGNPCRRRGQEVPSHPSRLERALKVADE